MVEVLEILSHVNKRVKHQSEIGLPLLELWKLYTDSNATPMVKNFCIVYIEMAFERTDIKEKENMAPMLLSNICKLPHQHQEIILRIATKQPSQGGGCPPGLSIAQSDRVTGKHPLKSDVLLMRKLGILNVIEAMELDPEVVYPIYLAASADCQEPVIKKGEELLKKKASTANFDDPKLMKKLFLLFNGTTGAENVAPESRVTPGSIALKAKLMSIFCRSITAANSFPATLQCIFGCIYGSGTTSRMRQLGMEFTVWVFKHAQINQLKLMGPVILNGILKLLDSFSNSESDVIARDTKTFSFQAIGLLAQRLPNLFRDKIDMAVRLFDALKVEAQSLRFIIQEATSSLAVAYKHCPSRFICMLAAADSRLDIR
ncbi:hypothetical protein GH714_042290 [Hevea brasiliensis]|uniref:Proteasome component Ecm29 N-terminal domain-containing protein n=1 Tax=Hevea brasiliensis TaxID=3981 RepID=A0A6A6KVG4_HEVBR|nr:hypothetical protein GH714_042290 [Hevea brasiliensis]